VVCPTGPGEGGRGGWCEPPHTPPFLPGARKPTGRGPAPPAGTRKPPTSPNGLDPLGRPDTVEPAPNRTKPPYGHYFPPGISSWTSPARRRGRSRYQGIGVSDAGPGKSRLSALHVPSRAHSALSALSGWTRKGPSPVRQHTVVCGGRWVRWSQAPHNPTATHTQTNTQPGVLGKSGPMEGPLNPPHTPCPRWHGTSWTGQAWIGSTLMVRPASGGCSRHSQHTPGASLQAHKGRVASFQSDKLQALLT
jgi:hypothetical protein